MPNIELTKLSPQSFPTSEDDAFEFKSSQTTPKELAKKLERAASAFANTGGGCFIAGIDDNGDPDGGISDPIVGRQSLNDWIDQSLAKIQPPIPNYRAQPFRKNEGRGVLEPGKQILAIAFEPSHIAPHMASDHRYYIRAGAHTVPANHWLVEALWAKREVQRPMLSHVLRGKPGYNEIVQLGIVALTDAPAINVQINLTPAPSLSVDFVGLPRRVPVINRATPFFLDVALVTRTSIQLHDKTKLSVSYMDLTGAEYTYVNPKPLLEGLPSLEFVDGFDRIARAIEKHVGSNLRAT